jgi:hypothetical protein
MGMAKKLGGNRNSNANLRISCQKFARQVEVVLGASRGGIVNHNGFTKRGSLTKPHVAGNNGAKYELLKVLPNLLDHLVAQSQSGVVHGKKNSFDL